MATEILIKNAASIILADTTHSPTAGVSLLGTRTHQINLTSLAANTYRQSAKFDFGTPRAAQYLARAAIEWTVAPTAGGAVDFYLGYSDNATAANSNPGNLSGTDSAWVGYGAAAADADEAVGQLDYIGSLFATADADIQVAELGPSSLFVPRLQYGILVVRNGTSQSFIADAVEMSVHLTPIKDEAQ